MTLQQQNKTRFHVVSLFFVLSILSVSLIPREHVLILFGLYTLLFGFYFYLAKSVKLFHMRHLFFVAIVSRIVLIPILPNLSDDYFRFIWDGNLSNVGFNPYLFTPQELVNDGEILESQIYSSLNSQAYYSVYPAVNQYIFAFCSYFGFGSTSITTMLMKILIIVADFGSIIILGALLKASKINRKVVAWYALNPLVVLEFSGNLHFEGFMIFFLLLSIWSVRTQLAWLSGIQLGFAICLKILPLIFIPFYFIHLTFKKNLVFVITIFITILGLFYFWYHPELFTNISKSIQLYFSSFEFNSSLYRVLTSLNVSQQIIKFILKGTVVGFVVVYWFIAKKRKYSVIDCIFWVYTVYLFCSQSIHPWYVIPLLPFALFNKCAFPYVWSFIIFFTYITYQNPQDYQQSSWVILIEYCIVFFSLVLDLWKPGFLLKRLNIMKS